MVAWNHSDAFADLSRQILDKYKVYYNSSANGVFCQRS
ncbi:hypothetical protein [Cohnella sp. 6021052837]